MSSKTFTDESIAEVVTIALYDGSDWHVLLVDSSGRVIAQAGNDGTNNQFLKCNSSGQLEIEVKGAA